MTIPYNGYSLVYGGNITIPCTITSSPSLDSSRWTFTKEGTSQDIYVTNGGRYSIAANINAPDLTIQTVVFDDSGTYRCIGTNAAGDGSDNVTLTVTGGKYNTQVSSLRIITCTDV